MKEWRKGARYEPIIVDLEALVPKDHLLHKVEKVMDYEWLYEWLEPYYYHTNGRPGTDPVVLIKLVLIQHLFGIPSLRQTYRDIQVNAKGQKLLTTHIWQEYLDIVETIRKSGMGKRICAQRKETIERVFADAKEKHAMRYTHHRGLAAVTRWVRLKFAAPNFLDYLLYIC